MDLSSSQGMFLEKEKEKAKKYKNKLRRIKKESRALIICILCINGTYVTNSEPSD